MSKEFLQGYTDRIKRYNKDIKNTYIQIAMNLVEIQTFELLKDTEYKNIHEYALNEFGYEKAKTYYLIDIYNKFFFEERKAKKGILTYGEYSISQLRYMLDMTDEQLKYCKSYMTVREIKEIKIKKSTRVDFETFENTEHLEKRNIITGVFPEKKEEKKETTLIISDMPKIKTNLDPSETISETKTTIVETITSQNNDFVPNEYETYKEKYNELLKEIDVLHVKISLSSKKIEHYKNNCQEQQDTMRYFYQELFNIISIINNEKLQKFALEFSEFVNNHKLPEKIKFMKEVV